jgi:hypothetical protein
MADRTPLRYQLYVLGGIVLFTATFGGTVYGIRAIGTSSYVEPACTKACAAAGGQFVDVDYRMGKRDHESMCLCSNGARIHSPEADTIGTASVVTPMGLGLLFTVLIGVVLARRARRK